MKKKKQAPIIHGTRVAWARYKGMDGTLSRTRLCQLWQWRDGSMRVYCGTKRIYGLTFTELCKVLQEGGWELVQGGC